MLLYTSLECSVGTFGEDCTRLCHCINNEPCDYQTGICPNGCGPGWTDVACNRSKCPKSMCKLTGFHAHYFAYYLEMSGYFTDMKIVIRINKTKIYSCTKDG